MLEVDDVLRAHFLICDYFIKHGEQVHTPGIKDAGLLISAVGRQHIALAGVQKWKTPVERAGTLMYGLVKNHAFHDGNKRTALLCALYALTQMGRTPTGAQKLLEQLAVRIAANTLIEYPRYKKVTRRTDNRPDADVRFISDYLQRNSRTVDARFHLVTYRELDIILQRFHCRFGKPRKNFIDVYYPAEEISKGFFGRSKRTTVEKKLQVGFPGWTREVAVGAITSIRRVASLRPEDGVDSQVFFKGADPMAALISKYHGPLERLKDK